MKKLFIGAMLLMGMSAFAQETYQNAEIATEDLNGTARYIGMGGAMEALGADISTIGTNPAGIGMFRRSQVALTAGVGSQADAASSPHLGSTNASLDQVGGVWSQRLGERNYFNIGFNYHKSRNFNHILSAADGLNNASQNKLTGAKGYEGVFDVYWNTNTQIWSSNNNSFNMPDYLYVNALDLTDGNGNWKFFNANGYDFKKVTKGYVGEYDINFSGNVSDRVYLGVTFGLKDVNYESYTDYGESIVDNNGAAGGSVSLVDSRRITGSGFDVKVGAIIFPIEDSAFRIGLNIATPTWYDLTTSNYTSLKNDIDEDLCPSGYNDGSIDENYDFRLNTPWKFGVSLGHTIGTQLALGLSYEFADYNFLEARVLELGGGSYYDETRSYADREMKENTKSSLKGVHTLKLGAEYKVTPAFALRAGYNFVSPMYDVENGYRNGCLNSPGSYYASTTDYTNWKGTNRLTLGAGYSFGSFAIDAAYQFSTTSGEFFPFMSYYGETAAEDNVADAFNVKDTRHQFVATLSYKF